jgi:TM2 domain-containing membrane protein YozV
MDNDGSTEPVTYCRNCGTTLGSQAAVCLSCGVLRGGGVGFCRYCARPVNANAALCVSCGAATYGSSQMGAFPGSGAKSRVTAGVLGILLGFLGVHRFYLGYTTIGVIQLVLTLLTFGVAGLWGFIEGILILCGQIRTDASGQPLLNM